MSVIYNIKKWRVANGYTQIQLAKELGYKSPSTICKVERGEVAVPEDFRKRFKEKFGIEAPNNIKDADKLEILRLKNEIYGLKKEIADLNVKLRLRKVRIDHLEAKIDFVKKYLED